jgi:hypothetical protein
MPLPGAARKASTSSAGGPWRSSTSTSTDNQTQACTHYLSLTPFTRTLRCQRPIQPRTQLQPQLQLQMQPQSQMLPSADTITDTNSRQAADRSIRCSDTFVVLSLAFITHRTTLPQAHHQCLHTTRPSFSPIPCPLPDYQHPLLPTSTPIVPTILTIASLDSNAGRIGKARMAPVARRVPFPPAIAPLDDNVALRERNYLAEVWGRLRQYPKPKGLDPYLKILKLRLKVR